MPKEKAVTKKSTIKKAEVKAPVKKTVQKEGAVNLSVPVFALDGTKDGTLALPAEIFGAKINKKLLSQALRVYLNNNTGHFSNTKTRGEVKGSTRKIRMQKGTGGARHGAVRAPIFVGGGIALGPKFRKNQLELPKKMKKAALVSALSSKAADQEVMGISGIDKATGKTSQMQKFLDKTNLKNVLVVLPEKNEKFQREVKNLEKVSATLASQIDALDLTKFKNILFTKSAIEKLELRINKPVSEEAK